MLYFAYGSNLDPEQMRTRCPGHRVVGVGVLADHRLTFPRPTQRWGGGAASVEPAPGQVVAGVVYDLTDEDLRRLDGYEGLVAPEHPDNAYDRETMGVDLVRAEDGGAPRRVSACIYIARPTQATPPSRCYLDAILRGARHHRLPEATIAGLERLLETSR